MTKRAICLAQLCGSLSNIVTLTQKDANAQIACLSERAQTQSTLRYRIPGDPLHSLNRLSMDEWWTAGELKLVELEFGIRCYIDRRRIRNDGSVFLRAHALPWWRRFFGRHPAYVLTVRARAADTRVTLHRAPLSHVAFGRTRLVIAVLPEQLALWEAGESVIFTQKPSS